MHRDGTPNAHDRGWLADWRRLVAELYAEVRIVAESDPEAAWEDWRTEREALYRGHPQSPLPLPERESFRAVHWPYDERLRFVPAVDGHPSSAPAPTPGTPGARGVLQPRLTLPNSGTDDIGFDRLGVVQIALPTGDAPLPVFWMRDYAGGLFLPFRDATNGEETYGAGRYVLDTAKGADLGGDPGAGTLVVDLNFAFHPSCAFDPRWACPLAPPGSHLPTRIQAGERLH